MTLWSAFLQGVGTYLAVAITNFRRFYPGARMHMDDVASYSLELV